MTRSLSAKLAIGAGAFALAACSFLVDTAADQCTGDADCLSFGAGRTCVSGVCTTRSLLDASDEGDTGADGPAPIACEKNADCTTPNSICQRSSKTCLSLTSAECPEVLGDYKDENAVIFGSILPITFAQPPDYYAGLAATGISIKDGLALAVSEFAERNPSRGLPPLPGSTAARPLVFVVCSDGHSAKTVAAATTHLASEVGVPAILGAAFSTYSRVIAATLGTLKKTDVLVMTPRSADLTPADNDGHIVRLSPVDAVQGGALAALVADREPFIKQATGAGMIKVALVHKEDAYGNAVAAAARAAMRFNGFDVPGNGPNFTELKYGNPDADGYAPQFASTALGIRNFKPHLIVVVGTNEVVTGLLAPTETNWDTRGVTYRPSYLLSDGVVVKELWDYLANNDPTDSIRKRILGILPTGTAARFNAFVTTYTAKYAQQNPMAFGAAGAYDAAYLLAYSAAGLGSEPITGASLLTGFGLLGPGGGALQVGVGGDDIAGTFAKLVGGQAVNLEGASSALDIDSASRAVNGGSLQVWCVPSTSGQAKQAILSGQTIDSTFNVQGNVSASCGQP